MEREYSTVIIGGGPAGYKAAEKLADAGVPVCIVELDETRIGGTCLNEGCVPAKSFIHLAGLLKRSGPIAADDGIRVFNSTIREKFLHITGEHIRKLRSGLISVLKKKGVEFMLGKASFIDAKTVMIHSDDGKEEIKADNIIIASGSRPKEIGIMRADGKKIFTSSQLMAAFPEAASIIFVGAGYIGCEFASLYRNLGAEVTLIEACEGILPGEDREIARSLEREFKKRGIRIFTGTQISSIDVSDGYAAVTLGTERERIKADVICVCIGRTANTTGLDIDKAGLRTENGFIPVDDNMRTHVRNIYAAGDVLAAPMLAYTAYREGEIAAASILKKAPPALDYNLVPGIIFTEPEIGCIGHTEDSARALGMDVRTEKNYFRANAKAVITGETAGFLKAVISNSDDCIIGAQMIGSDSCELIHILSVAVHNGLKTTDLSRVLFGHPVFAEIIAGLT